MNSLLAILARRTRALTSIFLLAALTLGLGACGDDEPEPTSMTWTVDGTPVQATSVTAQFQPASGLVAVTGTSATGSKLQIIFPRVVGVQPISSTGQASGIYNDGTNYAANNNQGSGGIIVNSVTDNSVRGTFSFTAPPTQTSGPEKVISNGSFQASF
ncbi:DUF6252 family protein [Hymenobacter sp. BT175]|uniref:DUF6252 family protein n=1 Tax=Hymenobacter translucens TaxID=2886507 RepID=UPI001D0EAF48|nr:DUF6252 family protein [Hymenobacter translucens]MCC2546049.1 DUF6252 family protein [Hymenobacter translucens]